MRLPRYRGLYRRQQHGRFEAARAQRPRTGAGGDSVEDGGGIALRLIIKGRGRPARLGIALRLIIKGRGRPARLGIALRLIIKGRGRPARLGIALRLIIKGRGRPARLGIALRLIIKGRGRPARLGRSPTSRHRTSIKIRLPPSDRRPSSDPRRRLRYASLTLASLTDGYQLGHTSIEACRP